MSIVWWDRADAVGVVDPLTIDELDGHVLVIDGVTAADDDRLRWCRRAPCVVIGRARAGAEPSSAPDIVLDAGDGDGVLEALVDRIAANPHACRVLVDVLRHIPGLDVAAGLTLESLAYSALLAGDEFAGWLAEQPARPSRDIDGPAVRVERTDDVLRIALARPQNRNAFSATMRDELFQALAVAEIDQDIDGIVLTGDGPVFSSGGDLTEFGTTPDVVRAHEIRVQRSVGALLSRLAPRSTVHVQGRCVGAGVELPAFAGRVVAAPDSTFRLPEIAMGLIPGAGGTVSITRRIGRQPIARLAILGEPIDAPRALALGLVDEVG